LLRLLNLSETMKTYQSLQLLLAAGLGFSAVSCVVETPAVTTTTVETYRPGYYTRAIPGRYETRTIRGTRYYYADNVYYRPQGEGYVVVDSPYGTVAASTGFVRTLPSGYRVVERSGRRYYMVGDTYYRPEGEGYVIVRDPF
jgi:hypothetical protein